MKVCVLAGDGIGPEITAEALRVLEALRSDGRLTADAFITRRLITGMTMWSSNWFDAHGSLTIDQLTDIILDRVIGEHGA